MVIVLVKDETMTIYIDLPTAMQIWESAYILAMLGLIGLSWLGFVLIAKIEDHEDMDSLWKWFS
jgi:hypothetical protein